MGRKKVENDQILKGMLKGNFEQSTYFSSRRLIRLIMWFCFSILVLIEKCTQIIELETIRRYFEFSPFTIKSDVRQFGY